jgi:hypothetical protein
LALVQHPGQRPEPLTDRVLIDHRPQDSTRQPTTPSNYRDTNP